MQSVKDTAQMGFCGLRNRQRSNCQKGNREGRARRGKGSWASCHGNVRQLKDQEVSSCPQGVGYPWKREEGRGGDVKTALCSQLQEV